MNKSAKLFPILLIFSATFLYSSTATWDPVPFSNDITDSNNWPPAFNTPTVGDEAFFPLLTGANQSYTPTLSPLSTALEFTPDLITIDNTLLSSGQYSFYIYGDAFTQPELNIFGAVLDPSGVKVVDRTRTGGGAPAAAVQNFYVDNNGIIEFDKEADADIGYSIQNDFQKPPFIFYNLGTSGLPGFLKFHGSSLAGAAGINVHNGSVLTFDDNSLAAIAQINVDSNSLVHFTQLGSASGAIVNATDSSVVFDTAASAFFSFLNLDHSNLSFSSAANVGSASINAINGSTILVGDACLTSGRATINLTDSSLTYKTAADAGQSTIIANNSQVQFQDYSRLSSLATIQLNNNSSLTFTDFADAGFSKIFADVSTISFGNFSSTNAFPNSDNASVVLNNGSVLNVNNFANFLSMAVLDSASVINFNNFLPVPMLFSSPSSITNGQININPFGPTASGTVVFSNAFNSYLSLNLHRGVLIGNSLNIVGNITNNGTIVFNQVVTQSFFGNITGPGNVVLQGGGTLIVESPHSIAATVMEVINTDTVLEVEPNALSLSTLLIGNGALVDFESPDDEIHTFNGVILDMAGEHGSIAINKDGTQGTVILSNPFNSYTGGTILYEGTLQINNGAGVPGLLKVRNSGASVVFDQQVNGTYSGQLKGFGIGSKIGPAKLIFPLLSQNQLQTLSILQGELELDGVLTSATTKVAPLATLSGGGTLIGDLEVFGTLAPGDGSLTFTVIGNVEFEPGSTFEVQVANGVASQLAVQSADDNDNNAGEIIIEENATVVVTLIDSSFDPTKTYTILSADNSLTGQFSSTQSSNPLIHPFVTYDARHAYLQMLNGAAVLGSTFNERQVAKQLGTINTSNPLVNAFILDLMQLPSEKANRALSQMSAEQYSQVFVTAQGVNQRFIRRLFDPLRETISSRPCFNGSCCSTDCGEWMDPSASSDTLCSYSPIETWMDISLDRSYYKGNKNANGFKASGYEISMGVQTVVNECWTLGLAGTYERDHLHFNLGGSGKNNTWLGAVYALYRPENYYILADLALGNSSQYVKRPIDVSPFHLKAKGKPRLFQGTTYFEMGWDYSHNIPDSISIQPFIGLEVDYFHLKGIYEDNKNLLAVHVFGKSHAEASSRLGVHFTTHQCQYSLAVDLAWQYRFTSLKNHFHERFIAFGNEFFIKGVPMRRNSLDGTINMSTMIAQGWELYGEAAGQVWEHAATFNFLLGLKGAF